MKQGRKIGKRGWAGIVAVALIAAIVLTGTLAWRSISQRNINDFVQDKNPGGRIHDDFNGENKDVYAENFTSKETGTNVFARIKLLEYMETGEDAGVNRTVTGADGKPVLNPDRRAKPLVEGMDITNTATWHTHIPGENAEQDPFHLYWTWKMGGETVYRPTFNKNKDSLSVDVNGTYVGKDGRFDIGEPYDDYTVYTLDADVTDVAYYDADPNTDDEYLTDPRADKVPGGGGTEKTEDNPEGNYTKVEETHKVQKTQNTVAVLTMAEWEAKGGPIGNYWVWDTDGWAYWAEPIAPQTATGLFLDQVLVNERTTEKEYYALEVVGQFADKGNWGTEGAADKKDQGFYADGFSKKAQALLNKVADAKLGENLAWYIPKENNVFQRINNDAGDLGDLVSAGPDTKIGTADDLNGRKVVYVEAGVAVGEEASAVNYGKYFLEPSGAESYYRGMGPDKLLGTADDSRLWLPAGNTFPEGVMDKVVDKVTVTSTGNVVEIEKGGSIQLHAQLSLNNVPLENNDVTWRVSTESGGKPAAGTVISPTGVLQVDTAETARRLLVIAASKKDDRVTGSFYMGVRSVATITLTTENDAINMYAGETIQLIAKVYHGDELVTENPADFTWETDPASTATGDVTKTLTVDPRTGILTVGRAHAEKNVEVTASYDDGGRTLTKSITLMVGKAAPITIDVTEISGRTSVKVGGGTPRYQAKVNGGEHLNDSSVTWTVGKSADGGITLSDIPGVKMSGDSLIIDKDTYKATDETSTIYVRATANDRTALGENGNVAYGQAVLTVDRPARVVVESRQKSEFNPEIVRPNRAKTGDTFQLKASILDSDGNPYPADALEWEISAGATDTANTKLASTTGLTNSLTISDSEVVKGADPHKVTVKVTSKVDPSKHGQIEIKVASKYWKDSSAVIVYDDWENGKARVLLAADENGAAPKSGVYFNDGTDTSWKNSKIRKYLSENSEDEVIKSFYRNFGNDFWIDDGQNEDGTKGAKILTRTSLTSDTFEVTYDKLFILTEADVRGTVNGVTATDPRDFTTGVVMQDGLEDPLKDSEGNSLNWKRSYKKSGSTYVANNYWLRSPHTDDDHKAGMNKDGQIQMVPSLDLANIGIYLVGWMKAESFYGPD